METMESSPTPQRVEDLKRLFKMTLEDRIQVDRAAINQGEGGYRLAVEALRPRLLKFLEKHKSALTEDNGSFPAVDIGTGRAVGTVHLNLFLLPFCDRNLLRFYPSEHTDEELDELTRMSLQYHIDKSNEYLRLSHDCEGEPLFPQDVVDLTGLKTTAFNGRRGILQGRDSQTAGRLAVQLSADPKDRKSFKAANLKYVDTGDPYLRELRKNGTRELYQGLLERTRKVDILERETWSNLDEINGQCILVTCMNCLGDREPTAWQDTLEFASKLLQVDGYVLQYDESGHGGFGDASSMKAFASENELGLELDEIKMDPNVPDFVIVIWKKL